MTKHVLLNNIEHKDLRVSTRKSAEYGDANPFVLTFPTEFGDIQREYPILIHKNPETGEFQSLALLGFEQGENLFLDSEGWQASYVPAVVDRGPFLIGFQNREFEGELRQEPVIHVDMDDPRVDVADGQRVFLEHGGNSPYIERISAMLQAIHSGIEISKTMFAAYDSLGLIESVSIEIELRPGQKHKLEGYYTITEERLAALADEDVVRLHRAGFLQGAYLIIASMNNMKKLINMKRARLS